MKGLIQRVRHAKVEVDNQVVGAIDRGLLLLLGVERDDGPEQLEKLAHKLLNYRVFADAQGKMNLSLLDIGGGILVVSQFTLVADTGKGLRPSFSSAAPPAQAESLYNAFIARLGAEEPRIQLACGRFGADMQVSLLNDGPVTFLLEA